MFLYHGNLGLLPVLRAWGDRALRLSFKHATLVGDCCMGKRLPQTSYCSSVQERRDERGQLVFLLPIEDRGRCGKGMSKRCLGCRIEWLWYQILVVGLLLSSREMMTLGVGAIFLVYFSHNTMSTWGVGVTYL
jgi:hypothetical protein